MFDNDKIKIEEARAFIDRFTNDKVIMICNQLDTIADRFTLADLKKLIYLLSDYGAILQEGKESET